MCPVITSVSKSRSNPRAAVVADVLLGEEHRHFHRYRHGIVDEHEPLQGLVPLLVVGCRRQRQSREARRMVFLSRHRWMDLRGKFGGAMRGRLKMKYTKPLDVTFLPANHLREGQPIATWRITMGAEKIPDIILSTLGFNASLLALLLAAQGYVAGRLPPAGERLWHRRLVWIVPGLLFSLFGIFWVACEYRALTRAVSHQETSVFAAKWINHFWSFYLILVVAIVATGIAAAMARNPEE